MVLNWYSIIIIKTANNTVLQTTLYPWTSGRATQLNLISFSKSVSIDGRQSHCLRVQKTALAATKTRLIKSRSNYRVRSLMHAPNTKSKRYMSVQKNLNPTQTGNTIWCGYRFGTVTSISVRIIPKQTFLQYFLEMFEENIEDIYVSSLMILVCQQIMVFSFTEIFSLREKFTLQAFIHFIKIVSLKICLYLFRMD